MSDQKSTIATASLHLTERELQELGFALDMYLKAHGLSKATVVTAIATKTGNALKQLQKPVSTASKEEDSSVPAQSGEVA